MIFLPVIACNTPSAMIMLNIAKIAVKSFGLVSGLESAYIANRTANGKRMKVKAVLAVGSSATASGNAVSMGIQMQANSRIARRMLGDFSCALPSFASKTMPPMDMSAKGTSNPLPKGMAKMNSAIIHHP
ncbi:MAG: hypothetical protein P4L77_14890 [Sulfuriferula sp.]|nr:hypothetical protein [Sulfuriferula sp.]